MNESNLCWRTCLNNSISSLHSLRNLNRSSTTLACSYSENAETLSLSQGPIDAKVALEIPSILSLKPILHDSNILWAGVGAASVHLRFQECIFAGGRGLEACICVLFRKEGGVEMEMILCSSPPSCFFFSLLWVNAGSLSLTAGFPVPPSLAGVLQ